MTTIHHSDGNDNSVAYQDGQRARRAGLQLNQNPYDPEMEVGNYEAWTDGWSSPNVDNTGGQV